MGTNYYFSARPPCPTCGRPHEQLHIGKSSFGWRFSLHVGRGDFDEVPTSWAGWIELFKTPGSVITDEYGRTVDVDTMVQVVTKRDDYKADGRLRRHHDQLCIGHPEDGDYDLTVGVFS